MILATAMYMAAFDPATFMNTVKGLLAGALVIVVGWHVLAAVGFGKVSKALVSIGLGALAFMVISGTILGDAAHWFQTNGLG